jgi:6-phosphogluconate dehydrogenase
MKIGMVGLGKMGGNMTTRLLKGGHEVVVYDRNEAAIADAVKSGADAATSLKDLVEQLESPRAVWIMVPAGEPTEIVIGDLESLMESHDTIIDGGNSNYKDSEKRAARLAEKGINFIDVGTSGGIWGLTEGYSMMIGGDAEVVNRLTQIFETLAPAKDKGWGHVGPSSTG